MFKFIFNLLISFVLLPFGVGLYMVAIWLDRVAVLWNAKTGNLQCLFGFHRPVERGPHRQECMHCHTHFDVDLMATNLEQHRIGFMEQDIYLGAVGKVNELPWAHDLDEGQPNQLAMAMRTYDILCVMWSEGMFPFRRQS